MRLDVRNALLVAAAAVLVACPGRSPGPKAAGVGSIAKVQGDGQTAVPGAAIPISPRVVVQDSLGQRMPGVNVQFAVTAGGGTIQSSTVATDSDGQASCGAWTLGPAPGRNTIAASVDGLEAVMFVATAASPTTVVKVAGDAQVASPGTDVAVVPVVAVMAGASPVAGATVRFTIASGGGSIKAASATTDAQGHASCGGWTLGDARGVNALDAAVEGVTSVTFVGVGVSSSPQLGVSIQSPQQGASWPGSGPSAAAGRIVASTQGQYSVVSVTATARSVVAPAQQTVPLAYGSYQCGIHTCSAWMASPTFDMLPRGPAIVVVTATDALGNSADAAVVVNVDRFPAITVTHPYEGAFAHATLQVDAACTDDDPTGCTVTASVAGTVVGVASGALSSTVDLSRWEGNTVMLDITVRDSAGQEVTVKRSVCVDSSPALHTLLARDGTILDVLGTRVLFVDHAGSVLALRILDMGTGAETTLEASADVFGTAGYLTPVGAIYKRGTSVYEWNGSSVSLVSNQALSLAVAGAYAVIPDSGGHLHRKDLVLDADTVLTVSAVHADVAENGDVVYDTSSPRDVFRWRGGTTTQLTDDVGGTVQSFDPLTDGTNVVYVKKNQAEELRRITLNDGGGEVTLAVHGSRELMAGRDYGVAGGWVAYAKPDAVNALQIWRHGPSGETQVTVTAESSSFEAVGPDGSIVLYRGTERYLAPVGAPLAGIGSRFGRVIYRDGRFLVLFAGNVIEVRP